ncbi:MAG: hypothetical protein NVS2B16_33340 [Chloroflexota bacterium]
MHSDGTGLKSFSMQDLHTIARLPAAAVRHHGLTSYLRSFENNQRDSQMRPQNEMSRMVSYGRALGR